MTEIDLLMNQLQSREANLLDYHTYPKYAVLLPLIKKENEWFIVFEVRSSHLKHQPGEICFPGGKVEEDDPTFEFAAKRETSEELGISMDTIEKIVPLDYFVTPYGKMIFPFAGIIKEGTPFFENEEVEKLFLVPLNYLKNYSVKEHTIHLKVEVEEDFPYEKIAGGTKYQWQKRSSKEYFYHYENKTIWGLTARILHHFLELAK